MSFKNYFSGAKFAFIILPISGGLVQKKITLEKNSEDPLRERIWEGVIKY